jgi:hypothetical protein
VPTPPTRNGADDAARDDDGRPDIGREDIGSTGPGIWLENRCWTSPVDHKPSSSGRLFGNIWARRERLLADPPQNVTDIHGKIRNQTQASQEHPAGGTQFLGEPLNRPGLNEQRSDDLRWQFLLSISRMFDIAKQPAWLPLE